MNRFYKIVLLFISCSLTFNIAVAQNPDIKRTNYWYFGEGAGLDFSIGTPIADINSNLHTIESSAVISDTFGNLLFYTDGDTVWNKNHIPMPNGTGLSGCDGIWLNSSTQGALIVPQPNSNNIYYIFTVDCVEDSGGIKGMNYTIVDMNLNGGFGDVTSKNNLLFTPSTEKLAAVHHCNKQDVWIVSHARDSNAYAPPGKFYAYLLTNAGINLTPVISLVGAAMSGSHGMGGVMKFSPDGSKLMCVNYTYDSIFYNYPLELFDFDNATGIISNPMGLSNEIYLYGGSFSPDGSKIYVSNYLSYYSEVFQYDISSGNQATIIASKTVINNVDSLKWCHQMQNAPDGKLYIARWNDANADSLAVIQNPNNTSCNFLFNGVALQGKVVNFGLPNFVESYFNADTSSIPCNVGIEESGKPNSVNIYPNPFNISTTIFINENSLNFFATLEIYDLLGRFIISKQISFEEGKFILNRGNLSNGIFLLKIKYQNKTITQKIVLTN